MHLKICFCSEKIIRFQRIKWDVLLLLGQFFSCENSIPFQLVVNASPVTRWHTAWTSVSKCWRQKWRSGKRISCDFGGKWPTQTMRYPLPSGTPLKLPYMCSVWSPNEWVFQWSFEKSWPNFPLLESCWNFQTKNPAVSNYGLPNLCCHRNGSSVKSVVEILLENQLEGPSKSITVWRNLPGPRT